MPTHDVCQQVNTPEQSFDEGYDPDLADYDAVMALYTGGGSSSSSAALSGQNSVGNTAVNAALFGGASGAATHVVKKGETLGTIAKLYTGDPKRYTELWEANQATLPNPNVVTEGQVLVLPDAWFNVRPGESEQELDTTPSAQPEDDRGWFEQGMDSISETVSGAWDTASDAVSSAWDTASDAASSAWDSAAEGVSETWDALFGEEAQQGPVAGSGQDQDQSHDHSHEPSPNTEGSAPKAAGWMVVSDGNALLRQGADFKAVSPKRTLPRGSRVRVIKTQDTFAQVETEAGVESPVSAADNLWTALSNLGYGGHNHALGNEKSDAADKATADGIRESLPEGRNPGQSPYTWSYGSGFATSLDGVSLKSSLLTKVTRMIEWAIANDMVTGNVILVSGMRSLQTAHRWSTAWNIQHGDKVSQEALEALPGGKDLDGNRWWGEGWDMEAAKANAFSVRPSTAIAAPGYPKGDPHRRPIDDRPGVSRHCSGGAIDVTIPWRTKGKNASSGAADNWGWPEIYTMFGLSRPVKSEHWHIEETGKELVVGEGDAEASPADGAGG